MSDRLDKALQYLNELLTGYGDRSIIVKQREDETYVFALGSSFVRFQFDFFGIHLYTSIPSQGKTQPVNVLLSSYQLTIVFHEAMFELLSAYSESLGHKEPNELLNDIPSWMDEKRAWLHKICPDYDISSIVVFPAKGEYTLDTLGMQVDYFDAESVSFLRDMGLNSIESVHDINLVLWELANHIEYLEKGMVELLVAISVDKMMTRRYIEENRKSFNNMVTRRKQDKKQERDAEIEDRKALAMFLEKKISSLKKQITSLIYKGIPNKVGVELMKRLKNGSSLICKGFNFDYIDSRQSYVRWFRLAQQPVPDETMDWLRLKWKFSEEAWKELYDLVEKHNEQYKVNEYENEGEKE